MIPKSLTDQPIFAIKEIENHRLKSMNIRTECMLRILTYNLGIIQKDVLILPVVL